MIPVYVNDIRCALKNKCYFTALSLTLTLPDICGIAEFPNKPVSERYITWYDKYLGAYMAHGKGSLCENDPWLSGEIVYNLRNTYLHQGNPGIASDKVKEEVNQLDKFILMLGDGTVLQTATFNIEAGRKEKITFRAIIVDLTYLCDSICDCALWYYENNQEKFIFNSHVITQEEFIHPSEEALQFVQGDVCANILNQKLEKEGSTIRFVENPNHRPLARVGEGLGLIFSDEAMKQRFLHGESTFSFTHPFRPMDLVETRNNDMKKKQSSPNVSKEKREAQVRSFFGRHFKKQIYLNKKEEIIQSVLKSKTKQQVNNNLMKHFTNREVSTIYQRLEPLIKNLPGK
ncbi:MAG: hypothetical protein K2O59_12690 [Lachnospiraceae bacterium]|nr:hypothetical protein [Lachnospiraceae bacterium]